MQRFITDERTGIQYELIGDYYYPCLTIENEEPSTLIKYGRTREKYLREHKKVLYFNLLTSGKLYEHLAEIDTSACNMAEYLIKEMARKIHTEPGWVWSLADQAHKLGIPVFMKEDLVSIIGDENMIQEMPEEFNKVLEMQKSWQK